MVKLGHVQDASGGAVNSNSAGFRSYTQKRVCVVSFWRFLTIQQASRLGTRCYLDYSDDELLECPTEITICLNSIYKLGPAIYDYIILDECGLIRRHFLSKTCQNYFNNIYNKFSAMIKSASRVILLQDGVSVQVQVNESRPLSITPSDNAVPAGTMQTWMISPCLNLPCPPGGALHKVAETCIYITSYLFYSLAM